MKARLFIILLVCAKIASAQTWVVIPDANFVTYLQSTIPAAMHSDSLNTSSTLVSTTYSINVTGRSISNLDGIQYFTSLTNLQCQYNHLNSLPALPGSLIYLNCSSNHLYNLPTLPNSLAHLDCGANYISTLPALPNSLTYLSCLGNSLTSLPSLPNSLLILNCNMNNITALPTLPSSLTNLSCQKNLLNSLPALPNSISFLNCNENRLTSLPTLPTSLTELGCDINFLNSLPPLPNLLNFLDCDSNHLTSLPALPNSLRTLWCYSNSLTSLPTLPDSLQTLDCHNNNISCFATFPNSIATLFIDPNPYNCLPNYLPSPIMSAVDLATPLCSAGNTNGCPAATIGIEKYRAKNNFAFTLFPNPTNGSDIHIDLQASINADAQLIIYDMMGRAVYSNNLNNRNEMNNAYVLNVSSLASGVYMVNLVIDKVKVCQKLIKN